MGIEGIESKLEESYVGYKRVKRKAWGHRNNHLWDKALSLVREDGKKASTHVCRLIRIEE